MRENVPAELSNGNTAMAFLGVRTASSWVHRVFGGWSACLDTPLSLEAEDLPLRSSVDAYRDFVERLRDGYPRLRGALITSHKAAVYQLAGGLFDKLTEVSRRLHEVGMVYWRNGEFIGDANDPLSTLHVARRLLSSNPSWLRSSRCALILGGGGAGVALANTLVSNDELGCTRVTIAEVDAGRATELRTLVSEWQPAIPVDVIHTKGQSDMLVSSAGEGGLIANATGLGKDAAGSPISPQTTFPAGSIVWDFNYRFVEQATPTFLEVARMQELEQRLTLEDGWDYFIWGWCGVMSNVVNLEPLNYHGCFLEVAERTRRSSSVAS